MGRARGAAAASLPLPEAVAAGPSSELHRRRPGPGTRSPPTLRPQARPRCGEEPWRGAGAGARSLGALGEASSGAVCGHVGRGDDDAPGAGRGAGGRARGRAGERRRAANSEERMVNTSSALTTATRAKKMKALLRGRMQLYKKGSFQN